MALCLLCVTFASCSDFTALDPLFSLLFPSEDESSDDGNNLFSHNLTTFINNDGKFGYVNKNGEWVIPAQFDTAGQFADNKIALVEVTNTVTSTRADNT